MAGAEGEDQPARRAKRSELAEWRQGDYTLSVKEFLAVDAWGQEGLEIWSDPVVGLCVVTQTCDIVNESSEKQQVVVSPLVEVTENVFDVVQNGSTPSAAMIENPPGPQIVVDLNRMLSIDKSVLVQFERVNGFNSDHTRSRFAGALERKHGRFAFPDSFAQALVKLRKIVRDANRKTNSEHGKAYRSIQTVRAVAFPDWDAADVKVRFYFVLESEDRWETTLDQISRTVLQHVAKFPWPNGFVSDDPPFRLVRLEEMSAVEWLQSHSVDWDFISVGGVAV